LVLGKTVGQLLSEISSREISEWIAYSKIEPFGERWADLRAATIVQAVILPHIAKGKKKPSLADCCLKFEKPKPMSVKKMGDFLKNLTRNIGGKVKGKQ